MVRYSGIEQIIFNYSKNDRWWITISVDEYYFELGFWIGKKSSGDTLGYTSCATKDGTAVYQNLIECMQ